MRRQYLNQRTNDPVKAHQISGPGISTISKLTTFDLAIINQSQPRVIIDINFVDLLSLVLNVKFQDLPDYWL